MNEDAGPAVYQERFRTYAELFRSLAEVGLDRGAILDRVARVLAASFGDACVIRLVGEDGVTLAACAAHHPDPEAQQLVEELSRRPARLDQLGYADAHHAGVRALRFSPTPEQLRGAYEPHQQPLVERLGLHTFMLAPLRARGRSLGTIAMGRGTPGLSYNEDDEAFLMQVAESAALVIANAELYEAAERARAEAESQRRAAERSAERVARLQGLTAALSGLDDPAEVARLILDQGSAVLQSDTAILYVIGEDPTTLELVGIRGVSEAIRERVRSLPIASTSFNAISVRTGEALWVETLEEQHRLVPVPVTAAAGITAFTTLPLRADGRVFGVVGFAFFGPHRFPPEERAFIETLAEQCAQALERARLFEAERRARIEAEQARLAAEQANRAKDEFLGIVSHELRTPLNAILGWAHLLKSSGASPAALSKGLEVITRNATAQAKIVEDILDVSRIITGKLTLDLCPTDPAAVARAALEVVRPAAEAKEIRLDLLIDGPIPAISADPDRLQQVVWNLLSNAVKFTPKGGRIELSLARAPGEVRFVVSDDGIGIEPEFLPFIFERFRQADSSTSRRHGGLGLGLAIVRHLVELHGGAVRAESGGRDRGTRMIVTLPAPPAAGDEPAAPANGAGAAGAAGASLQGVRVLVVDDDPDAREVLREILASYGAIVHVAGSSDEAIRALIALRPDVLLSDIGMPEEDGFSLIRRVRALSSPEGRIPAIALTAYAGEGHARKAELSGFQSHLAKPVDPPLLAAAIASAAGRFS